MANPRSRGKIIYSDGTVVNVNPGAVVTVQDQAPGGTGPIGGPTRYVIGGAMVAGAVVGIVALTNGGDNTNKTNKSKKNKDNPASP